MHTVRLHASVLTFRASYFLNFSDLDKTVVKARVTVLSSVLLIFTTLLLWLSIQCIGRPGSHERDTGCMSENGANVCTRQALFQE